MNYFNEGNKLYNIQNYNKAIDYYKKSAENNLNKACSYYNAGVCFIKLKDYDNAIDMLRKALNLQSESKYIFNLGYCYAMKEHNDKALRLFNLAWSLNHDDSDCEKAINLILSRINDK